MSETATPDPQELDDVEAHRLRSVEGEDDVEGHKIALDGEDDVEGHKFGLVDDEDDVEGHKKM